MAVTVPEMLKMSQTQLDDLLTESPVGEIPKGEAKGTILRGREKFLIPAKACCETKFCPSD